MNRKVDPAEKRKAIARIHAGASTYGKEAKRLGITKATLHEAAQKVKPNPSLPDPRGSGAPLDPSKPAPAPGSALDAARAAAGLPSASTTAPITPDELRAAGPEVQKQDGDYCVATVAQIKTLSTLGVGTLLCRIPMGDERLFKAGQLGKTAEDAVRAAAPELAPLLKKYLPEGSSLVGLAVVLMMDAAGTYQQLRELALEYKAKREAEKKKKEEEAKAKAGAAA